MRPGRPASGRFGQLTPLTWGPDADTTYDPFMIATAEAFESGADRILSGTGGDRLVA